MIALKRKAPVTQAQGGLTHRTGLDGDDGIVFHRVSDNLPRKRYVEENIKFPQELLKTIGRRKVWRIMEMRLYKTHSFAVWKFSRAKYHRVC